MNRSLVVKVVVCLAIVAIPVGYYAMKSRGNDTGMSVAKTTAEYRTEAAGLALAPGWRWPGAPIRSHAADGREIRYEKGWGRQAADSYWYCSWAARAVDTHVAAAARREALDNVLALRKTFYYRHATASATRAAFDRLLTQASHGDLRGLANDSELNCPKPGAAS